MPTRTKCIRRQDARGAPALNAGDEGRILIRFMRGGTVLCNWGNWGPDYRVRCGAGKGPEAGRPLPPAPFLPPPRPGVRRLDFRTLTDGNILT